MLGNKVRREKAESSLVLRALLVGFVAGYFTRRRGEAARITRALARAISTGTDAEIRNLTLPVEPTDRKE